MPETPILPPNYVARLAAAEQAAANAANNVVITNQPSQIKQADVSETASPAPVDFKKEETQPDDTIMEDSAPIATNDASSIPMQDAPSTSSQQQQRVPILPSNSSVNSPAPASALPISTPQRLANDNNNSTTTNSRATSLQPEKTEKVELGPAPTVAVLHGAPVRQYLNSRVTASVLEGMKILAREQPEEPLRWLGDFLLERSKEFEGGGVGGAA